jgi:hypothetical protein
MDRRSGSSRDGRSLGTAPNFAVPALFDRSRQDIGIHGRDADGEVSDQLSSAHLPPYLVFTSHLARHGLCANLDDTLKLTTVDDTDSRHAF